MEWTRQPSCLRPSKNRSSASNKLTPMTLRLSWRTSAWAGSQVPERPQAKKNRSSMAHHNKTATLSSEKFAMIIMAKCSWRKRQRTRKLQRWEVKTTKVQAKIQRKKISNLSIWVDKLGILATVRSKKCQPNLTLNQAHKVPVAEFQVISDLFSRKTKDKRHRLCTPANPSGK